MKKNLQRFSILLLIYIGIHWLTAYIPFLTNRSIENQIYYINQQLLNDQDSVLQNIYPEGLVFSNAIFALAIIDYSKSIKHQKAYAKIVDRIVEILISEKANQSFPVDMKFKYGAFYNGWINFVLSKYRKSLLFENSKIKETIIFENERISKKIYNYQKDSIEIIHSYTGLSWPADNMVCIASLPEEYKELRQKWVAKLIRESDSELRLINHYNGDKWEVRGSSQALILYFLREIGNQSEIEMGSIYSENYIDKYLSVQLVKEHLDGVGNGMDIDSGPIVFGYGAVATIINTKYKASKHDWKSKNTWGLLNFMGLPVNLFGRKFYLFKQQLMYDIFMVWTAVEIEKT